MPVVGLANHFSPIPTEGVDRLAACCDTNINFLPESVTRLLIERDRATV